MNLNPEQEQVLSLYENTVCTFNDIETEIKFVKKESAEYDRLLEAQHYLNELILTRLLPFMEKLGLKYLI